MDEQDPVVLPLDEQDPDRSSRLGLDEQDHPVEGWLNRMILHHVFLLLFRMFLSIIMLFGVILMPFLSYTYTCVCEALGSN